MSKSPTADADSTRDMEEQAFRLQALLDGLAELIEATSPTGTVDTRRAWAALPVLAEVAQEQAKALADALSAAAR